MTRKNVDISEKIARQIEQIIKKSVEIDIDLIRFVKEDYEEIKKIAKEQNMPPITLVLKIMEGVGKGLIESGEMTMEEIGKILGRSETSLRTKFGMPARKNDEETPKKA